MSDTPRPLDAAALQALVVESPFTAFLGLELRHHDPKAGVVVLRLPARPETARLPGADQFHGGVLGVLVDTAGDLAVAMAVGGGVPTIDMRVDYLRPATGPWLDATATARRVGRTIGVADIEVHDEQGRLCALGRAVYAARVG
jgi:uncharacterized protein (TIGR00369 family)